MNYEQYELAIKIFLAKFCFLKFVYFISNKY